MTTIEAHITALEVSECMNDYCAEMLIIHRLKLSGIPVKGNFHYQHVTSGTLEWRDDPVIDCRIYKWTK